ncbi:MAG: hypothetical protein WC008_06335 [Bacilli bacterium]
MKLEGALKPIIKPTDSEFNGASVVDNKIKLFIDGCLMYAPVFEKQHGIYFDTYGCVSYSMANAFEILIERMRELGLIYDSTWNWLIANGYIIDGRVRFSNRWLVVRSGTIPNLGNSGHQVIRFIKENGLAPLTLCDWDLEDRDPNNTKEAYYNADTINPKADKVASEFAKIIDVFYEWVSRDNFNEASQYGAIQVYTQAWYRRDNGLYYNPEPGTSGHAINMGEAQTNKILDQYVPQIKQMEKREDFYYYGLKINISDKSKNMIELKDNTLVQLVSGNGGFGLYLDGNILIDDEAKILLTFIMRNSKVVDGEEGAVFNGGPIRPLLQEDWDKFPKKNLKLEDI